MIVKRGQCARVFYAIKVSDKFLTHQGRILLLCFYVQHVQLLKTSCADMGMHSLLSSIQSSTGKGFPVLALEVMHIYTRCKH